MSFRLLACAAALAVLAARAEEEAGDVSATAHALAQSLLLADTHIDVPYRLRERWADVTRRTADGQFDYERAVEGGLDLAFMSIYTPASIDAAGGAFQLANELIDSVEAMAWRAPRRFVIVRSAAEAMKARENGLVGLALGMENGAPIAGQLENLGHFHARGIRYITLAHSESNHLADSSFGEKRQWNGLSPFGREVVAGMNRLGIMVDVSHLSDDAVRDVLEASRAPVIASHSSARHFTPGFERNFSDELIRAVAAKGGVVQVNFGSIFLTENGSRWIMTMFAERKAWLEAAGHAADSAEAQAWSKAYQDAHPPPRATLAQLAEHFDHLIGLVGPRHVGIGSDFDGVGDTLPVGIADVSQYPALIEEFLRRGYSHAVIEGILGGNLMRVWAEVEAVAQSTSPADAVR